MYAIQPQQRTPESKDTESGHECTPNILPCRIHYNGSVESLNRYWTPSTDEKDKDLLTAYFRGRRLRGRRVQVPEGYDGVIVTHTEREIPNAADSVTVSKEGEHNKSVKLLEKQATFGDYVVWGHEVIPAADDSFVKGVEEWVKFAELMHSDNGYEKKAT